MLPLSSHCTHSFASALRHTGATTFQWLQLNKLHGHNVPCCALLLANLLQCSKWVFSFCTDFFPRSLTWGKKNCTEAGENLIAGAWQLGQSWPGGLGRDGWPDLDGCRGLAWQGRGLGTCVLLRKNVHRNRLECHFRAVCQWKNQVTVFYTGFFLGGTGFSPTYNWFFQGKNLAKLRGKSSMFTDHRPSAPLSLFIIQACPISKTALKLYLFLNFPHSIMEQLETIWVSCLKNIQYAQQFACIVNQSCFDIIFQWNDISTILPSQASCATQEVIWLSIDIHFLHNVTQTVIKQTKIEYCSKIISNCSAENNHNSPSTAALVLCSFKLLAQSSVLLPDSWLLQPFSWDDHILGFHSADRLVPPPQTNCNLRLCLWWHWWNIFWILETIWFGGHRGSNVWFDPHAAALLHAFVHAWVFSRGIWWSVVFTKQFILPQCDG